METTGSLRRDITLVMQQYATITLSVVIVVFTLVVSFSIIRTIHVRLSECGSHCI